MRFAWMTGEGDDCYLIEAENEDAAYEVAIAQRLKWGNENREDAEEWFGRNDQLMPILGELKKGELL